MPQFYVVKGIGGGFDGLVVEGKDSALNLVEVVKLTDRDSIVGDRNVSLPVPESALFISKAHLDEIEDPGTREFASDNPFGKHLADGNMEMGGISIHYSEFEKVLNVTVLDMGARKTVLSQYFFKNIAQVKEQLANLLKENGGSDVEDLVFRLRELKEAEANG